MVISDTHSYELAIARLEELESIVNDDTPKNDVCYKEMDALLDAIDEYESVTYPIEKPSLSAVIKLRMYEMGLSQTRLSQLIGVSTNALRRYITGKSEPSLSTARKISNTLNIDPAVVLGV